MAMPTNYNWLFDLLMRSGGEAMDALDPSRVSQRGRAQLASSRRWDQEHEAAQAHALERGYSQAQANAQAAQPPSPQAPHIPPQVQTAMRLAPSQRPYPGQGAPVQPMQRPYPGQGAPIRPPMAVLQSAARPAAPAPQAAPQARPPQQMSPQDYYAMLQSGMFRMG
jgi:hypothetical protein